MNALYIFNISIFAVFFTLFTIEVGIALQILLGNNKIAEMIRYITPIWEITGTFAVFFVMNFIATFPSAISIIGTAYVAPLLIAALFFIFRNAFLAYGIYYKGSSSRVYLKVYGLATLITGFLVISVLSSAISGFGINLGTDSINLFTLFVNPFFLIILVSVIFISLMLNSVIFHTDKEPVYFLIGIIGIIMALLDMHYYLNYAFINLLQGVPLLLLVIIVFAVMMASAIKRSAISMIVPFVWMFLIIILFSYATYPYWFGKEINATSYLSLTATGTYVSYITIIGGALLTIALIYFVYISYFKSKKAYS